MGKQRRPVEPIWQSGGFRATYAVSLILYSIGMPLVVDGEGASELFFAIPGVGGALLLVHTLLRGRLRKYGWVLERAEGNLWGPFGNKQDLADFSKGHDLQDRYETHWIRAKTQERAARIIGVELETAAIADEPPP